MCEVMLDGVDLAAECRPRCLRQQARNARPIVPVAQAVEHQRGIGDAAQQVADLAQQMRTAVLVDCDVVDVGEAHAGLAQAIGDGLGGKAGPVLDAAEALLLGGGDQHAVAQDRRGRVAVECVEPEDDHVGKIMGR